MSGTSTSPAAGWYPDPGGAAGPTTGTAGGVAQAAALEADLRNVAVAEETVYTERQTYVAAISVGAALTVGDQAVRVSVPGETVTVVLNGRHDAYCVVARRT